MRVWYREIAERLLGPALLGGLFSLVVSGCEAPTDIVPVTPPGAVIPRQSPDAEPAAAQGEMASPLPPLPQQAGAAASIPAPPTAKGETKSTPGGVTYETIKEGTGDELKAGQAGEFLYVGKLEDGKVFDGHTRETNQPQKFVVGPGVIKGWQEGLPGMKVGEVRKLVIPPALGYGASGHLPDISPNATLIFEVELVRIPGS
jgi:FKBP-type peptidyl-prolyl cis-trans isomerase